MIRIEGSDKKELTRLINLAISFDTGYIKELDNECEVPHLIVPEKKVAGDGFIDLLKGAEIGVWVSDVIEFELEYHYKVIVEVSSSEVKFIRE